MEENNGNIEENPPIQEDLTEQIEDEQEILNEMDSLEKVEPISKTKKPRSKAQIAAFDRAREVLAAKRKAAKELKMKEPKKALGRPPKQTVQEPESVLKVKKTKQPKAPVFIDETESSDEEPVVYVKKKPKKRRPKKPLKIVYVSASESSSDSEQEYETNQHQQPLVRNTPQQQPAPPSAVSFTYV